MSVQYPQKLENSKVVDFLRTKCLFLKKEADLILGFLASELRDNKWRNQKKIDTFYERM